MSDLVGFLRARLDEDEAVAREALEVNSLAALLLRIRVWWEYRDSQVWRRREDHPDERTIVVGKTWAREGQHIARWDPARVLAEVAAKRAVLDDFERLSSTARENDDGALATLALGLRKAIGFLAQTYASHPDFDPAWRTNG